MFAFGAKKNIGCQQALNPCFAHDSVIHDTLQISFPRFSSATWVNERHGHYEDVYNLTVEGVGVYYANNILVSNCDTVYDAIQIALADKTLYNQFKPDDTHDDAFARALATDIDLRGRY